MTLTARIKKRYGEFRLDVNFSAGSEENLALLGASGCGKSATLRCIAGIDRPDWGYIALDGRVLFDSERRIDLPPQQRRIGYLFQQYALFPNMSVEQNIAACLGRMEKALRRKRVEELIALLRLEGTEKLLPRQISGGQQQRTALARILASEPAAILLDEPLSALDSYLKWQLEQELREVLGRFNGPVVWVSHDRGEAYRNCRRVCVLERGKSSAVMEREDLMERPGTVSAARISGCKNFVPIVPGPEEGTVRAADWGVIFRTGAAWQEGVTTLGIRAEQIRPAEDEAVNAVSCRVAEVAEDVSVILAALRPETAAPDAPLLWMELDKKDWAALADRVRVSVRPEDVMLLR